MDSHTLMSRSIGPFFASWCTTCITGLTHHQTLMILSIAIWITSAIGCFVGFKTRHHRIVNR